VSISKSKTKTSSTFSQNNAVNNQVFPLQIKAERNGIFTCDKGCLISAPTATGKTQIGIEIIKRKLPAKPSTETFLYVVPFKALAEEVYAKLCKHLPNYKVYIKTGDYDKPFKLNETDVLVATYESVEGIVQEAMNFYPTLVIADEFSIIADQHRGAKIEALIAYLSKNCPSTSIFALSAVLREPEKIAEWLGTTVLKGEERDRPVPLHVESVFYSRGRKSDVLEKLVKQGLDEGSVLIFCSTRKGTENLCRALSDLVSSTMTELETQAAREVAEEFKESFPYLVDLPELVRQGIAYHNAELEVALRKAIADAFSDRRIKVLVATTTVAAGVNFPARTVIVRDITRNGRLIPVSEIVNMLGRAGRPTKDPLGKAYYLVPKEKADFSDYKNFIRYVNKREVEKVESQIPRNPTNTLQFILATAARFKGIERDDLLKAYNNSLWGLGNSLKPPMLSEEDTVKRIEQILEPQPSVTIRPETIAVSGNTLSAKGGGGDYDISISPSGSSCTCDGYKFGKGKPCKHIKQLQYEAIKGNIGKKIPEAAAVAILSVKETGLQQDPMFMLAKGVKVLLGYGFLEERERKLFITQDGRQALVNYLLSMDHVRILRDRMKKVTKADDEKDIIGWAIEDYKQPRQSQSGAEEKPSGLDSRLEEALWEHIDGKQYREIRALEQRYIQSFLAAKDQLDQIFGAYLAFCAKSNSKLASQIRTAKNRVHYGCKKEHLPLMILRIEEIADSDQASALFRQGIKDLKTLASSSEHQLSTILGVSLEDARRAVEKAKSILSLVNECATKPIIDRSELSTLAARTGVKIDDLLDYLLPAKMSQQIRGQ
jgi:helicase